LIRSHDSAWTSSGKVGRRECKRSSSRRFGDKCVIGRDGSRAVSSRGSFGVDVGSQNATCLSLAQRRHLARRRTRYTERCTGLE